MESETLQRRRASHDNAPFREKRLKRNEVLAKKKAVEELIKACTCRKGPPRLFPHVSPFPRKR
ncbi:N-alpha-acetyltransferase 40 [Spatholobus suberectus]|nr:N-alpha-acetyltransferase 40 [Spatholobus suberectus]